VTSQADVVVVGGGLAGLSAAVILHWAGLTVIVCEAGDQVGGRVRTDRRDGFLLDRGFQVVLPGYPELRWQVDLSALGLRPFLRGVLAMTPSGRTCLAPPWHGRWAAAGTAGFLRGRPGDSLALAALSLRDMLAPDEVIRATDPAVTTRQDLRGRVSQATLAEVLRPFLAGVFLDPSLDTPTRLFHLIWRCFLRGGGALPDGGMQMLPTLLADGLSAGAVRTGTEGKSVLVTGAASGIGLAAAAGFADLGASVWALARDDERASQAVRLIRARARSGRAADVRSAACDLSSLAALREFTSWFGRHEQRLDVLVNNAGVMPGQRTRTADGVELTFATHVLAPGFLSTN
jgi:phytoene dehydrogenase-like protein